MKMSPAFVYLFASLLCLIDDISKLCKTIHMGLSQIIFL